MSDGLETSEAPSILVSPALELRDVQLRLVWPFFFDPARVQHAADALLGAAVAGRTKAWECAQPPAAYCDEVPAHVQRLLFPGCEGDGRCAYLRISDQQLNEFFSGQALLVLTRMAVPEELRQVPVKPVWGLGIEMFLTTAGVGILSIALAPATLDPGHLIDINYELSRLSAQRPALIRIPHPDDDPILRARIPSAQREAIVPPPADNAPLAERMGRRGGAFSVRELIDELVQPLAGFGYESAPSQLSLYTVVRTGPEVDFANRNQRERIGPLISALAQIEELWHAGAPADELGIPNEILNRRHWAAVGSHGAAHLVADQPPPDARHTEHPFNSERVPRIRDRYFVPYAIALVQRLVIQRAVRDAGRIVLMPPDEAAGPLRRLREELLQFGVGGQFSHVSNRHAVDRFYELSRRALGTPTAWNETQQVISELDSAQLGASVAENVSMVAHVQQMVEWIEILLISVYAAHLWHMASEPLVKVAEHDLHVGETAGHLIVGCGTLIVAFLAGLLAALFLKPWKLRIKQPHWDVERGYRVD